MNLLKSPLDMQIIIIFVKSQIKGEFNLLKPTGYVMHYQFNIQQLYVLLRTVFMCFVFI